MSVFAKTGTSAVLLALSLTTSAMAQVSVTTWHDDLARTRANNRETVLTPANVNKTTFGKLCSYPVDGQVYAEPLYVPGLVVNGANHDVAFVATEHVGVYAVDADCGSSKPLWQTSFLGPHITPASSRSRATCTAPRNWAAAATATAVSVAEPFSRWPPLVFDRSIQNARDSVVLSGYRNRENVGSSRRGNQLGSGHHVRSNRTYDRKRSDNTPYSSCKPGAVHIRELDYDPDPLTIAPPTVVWPTNGNLIADVLR